MRSTLQPREMVRFTSAGRFGYFRHILRAADLPVGELLAAHLQQAGAGPCRCGNPTWTAQATQELITLLRDDYPTLMAVLGACRRRYTQLSKSMSRSKPMIDPEMKPIGYIVGGGLKENLHVRLTVPPQEVQEGSFVVIERGDWQFYGLVTDLQLGSTDPRFADEQSETRLPPGLAACCTGRPSSPTWKCCRP